MNINPTKRQLSFNHLSNVKIKKLRATFDKENLSITSFEQLSNELLYEIFDYLDGYDIYKGFSKLNIRFHNLISFSSLPLKINFSKKSQPTLEHCCRNVIIPNKHRLLSLHLDSHSIIHNFFIHCYIDSSFNHLQSIILSGFSDYKILMILFYLNSLPCLSSLTIELEDDSYYNISDIYQIIFRLPCLKFNKMSLLNYDELNISIPISINQKFSIIEHLILNHDCNIDELTSILSHTPQLRHLTCQHVVETDEIVNKEILLTLSNLIHVSFVECSVKFDILEKFIKKISSQLKVWHLNTFEETAYLDANRWRRLITNHIPHLCKFYFNHHMSINNNDIFPNCESINQFTSIFCTKRQWFFEFKDQLDTFVYSIYPYRKTWYNHYEYEQFDVYSDGNIHQQTSKFIDISCQQETTNSFIQSIQLTIENHAFAVWYPSYTDHMKPCLLAVKFTHLKIHCNDTPIDMLIELIHLMPNLQSLEVLSLPLVNLTDLSRENTEMLLLVSINNKITKVKFDKMVEINQIHFLMNLCPRMQYLEIGYTTENNLENIVGSISMNNTTHILYLCGLCLYVSDANEKTIQRLHSIIDFERLFHPVKAFCDYTIRRIGDKIYLKWKL
ncbi:unnamed protein product [Rotaria sp. Silwood2]|nr:unnamed protein product [Rotaria sp. Silwood2]CAF4335368.1 unnamed protein product [Rotaria sp. Silwood2]CAF4405408.1 unnamed protein product [Rotaria sp. Silwood2]